MSSLCRRTALTIVSLPLLAHGALAEEQPVGSQPPAVLHTPDRGVDAPTTTPEPNTALLAGLGGLALLFFALRRK